jgi:hypothetical protein
MSRTNALALPYIEANPTSTRALIVIDHDNHEATEIADSVGLPEPSYISLNHYTGCGHLVYALTTPVCMSPSARPAPQRLLSMVERGLNLALGGDNAYGGRITKNPTNPQHTAVWGPHDAVFDLRDLAKALNSIGALSSGKPPTLPDIAVSGRNVALFDVTRTWAYGQRRHYTSLEQWADAVLHRTRDFNTSIVSARFASGALPDHEVTQIALSVAKWTWLHIHNVNVNRSARGLSGGTRSGAARTQQAEQRAHLILSMDTP